MKRIFELLADAATVVACVVMCIVLLSSASGRQTSEPYQKGGRIQEVEELQLDRADRTLLLLLSSKCKYCAASMPFYQRVAAMVNNGSSGNSNPPPVKKNAQLVVITTDDASTAMTYLKANSLTVRGVVSMPASIPSKFSVAATPTLILTDRNGLVQDIWTGLLTAVQEEQVITQLFGQS